MATVTFSGTGLASDTARWSGGALPVLGVDKVVIAAGAVCTLDGAVAWGDDTSTALTINGVIKASRSAASQLTARGQIVLAGTLDLGNEADPIAAGNTATLVFNDSAVPAHLKWGVTANGAEATLRAWGSAKTGRSVVIAVHSTVQFDVADAGGWLVGDWLCLGPTSPALATIDWRAISAITALGGVAARVTVAAAPGTATAVGRDVANITRNVRIVPSVAGSFAAAINYAASSASGQLELGDCEIVGAGGSTSLSAALIVAPVSKDSVKAIKRVVFHDVAGIAGAVVTPASVGSTSAGNLNLVMLGQAAAPLTDALLCSRLGVGGVCVANAGSPGVVRPTLFGVGALFPNGAFSGNSYGLTVSDPYARGFVRVFANNMVGPFAVSGGSIGGFDRIAFGATVGVGMSITDCDLNGGGLGQTSAADTLQMASVNGAAGVVLTGCQFPPGTNISRSTSNLVASSQLALVEIVDKNNDPTAQERYTRGGQMIRDNAIAKRGTSSVRFDCWYSANAQTYAFNVPVAAGATITLRGSMRFASAYGTTYPPTVTVSGLGITPAVATCPTSAADTWHDYALTVTNPNAYPGSFTVTYAGRSTANAVGAYCYFDGVVDAPWVTVTRHYGYVLDSQAAVTVDSSITIAEAAALALPVAVDHALQTITITGALTADQVRQACIADECAPGSLIPTLRPAHVTTPAGVVFATTYTVVLGSGGSIAGSYADATGRKVVVSAPALVAGTRVQLYDVTTATELFNGVIGSGGLTFSATWTTDHNIRLRADHADKLPLQTLGVLTSSGLSFLDVQADDTVYATNGVDGSTATEFAPDGANIQIDIDDPDGVTSIQRLYAWMQWYQTTSAGIASVFFGAMVAVDAVTYIIDQAAVNILLDNVSALPVRIVGGYLARKDGSTVIALTSGSIQMDPGKAYLAGAGQLADSILSRNLAGGIDGGRTVRDALRASRNRTEIVGSTLTVYAEDDATPAWTAAISTGPRDALMGVDPT